MKKTIQLMIVFVMVCVLPACEKRNAAQQNAALQQTAAAATLQAMVAQGGGQQPSGGGQQPSGGGQQPSEGGGQPSEGGGQPEPPHPSGDQADLAVTKIELSDTSPDPNQTIQVKVTIENRGPGAARNFQWGVIPTYSAVGPNNPVGGETVSLLNAGVAKIYQTDVVYPSSGVYILRAVADLNNSINDPDRNNNVSDMNVGVTGALPLTNQKPTADLKVTNVTASNLAPNVNEEITISATVFNGGPEAVKNLTWGIYTNYQPNALINNPSTGVIAQLNPNDDTFISARASYSVAGTYLVKVVADYLNAVNDPHAGGAELQIKVGGGNAILPGETNADVRITSLTITPNTPGIGEQALIAARIDNLGPDTITNLDWEIYPTYVAGSPDNPVGRGTIDSLRLNANEGVNYTFTYPTIGTMKVHMVIDPQHKITDPNTGNNTKDIQVRILETALPPAPSGCHAWSDSPHEAWVAYTAPGDSSRYDGIRIYEETRGLMSDTDHPGTVLFLELQPNTTYYFYIVSYKGALESARAACTAVVKTPAN